ncbi:hypothetical protein HHI36_011676, partial [Cryptolaemus montrouzieri]
EVQIKEYELIIDLSRDLTRSIGTNQSLSIVHVHIKSLNKNLNELLIYMEELQVENVDIIVLSETFIIRDLSLFNIPKFKPVY